VAEFDLERESIVLEEDPILNIRPESDNISEEATAAAHDDHEEETTPLEYFGDNQVDGLGYPITRIAAWTAAQSDGSRAYVMDSIGILHALKIERNFDRAEFWDRKCPLHHIDYGTHHVDAEVFAAAYNECTGVSNVSGTQWTREEVRRRPGPGRWLGQRPRVIEPHGTAGQDSDSVRNCL
jgi:hypothetical protein